MLKFLLKCLSSILRVNLQSCRQNCSRRHSIFFKLLFIGLLRLDTLHESSARQTFHMKCQGLFSVIKKRSSVIMISTLRAKVSRFTSHQCRVLFCLGFCLFLDQKSLNVVWITLLLQHDLVVQLYKNAIITAKSQWREHLWDHGNLFKIWVVWATEG